MIMFTGKKVVKIMTLTCPRLTSNSSSTHGVKSCSTTILLSGDSPFSFSIPTRTKVSIEALPVMRPIPGPRITSLSPSSIKTSNNIKYVQIKAKKKTHQIILEIKYSKTKQDLSIIPRR